MNTNKKVLIIGAGIIGCAITFELQKKGYTVTCIDKHQKVGWGSTSNSTAIIRTCYSTVEGVSLAYEGTFYWKNWQKYVQKNNTYNLAQYVECGMTQIMAPDNHWKKVLPIYDQLGIEYQLFDSKELISKFPFMSPSSYWPPSLPSEDNFWEESTQILPGAMYAPNEGYVTDPQLAAENLQEASEKIGAKFILGQSVTDIIKDQKQVLGITLDNTQNILADIVINASGPYSFIINDMAGVKSDMRVSTKPLREEVHCVPAPPGIDIQKLGSSTSDNDNGIYFRPESGNMILVGGGKSPDDKEWIEDPNSFNRNITESLWKTQVYRLAKRIPELQIPNEKIGVVDLYDVTEDWIPIYDRSELDGFYMAIGTSGNQFKNAGAVGHLMAQLIDKCEHGYNHDENPLAIKGKFTNLELNLGFYSRLRNINKKSSMSVLG